MCSTHLYSTLYKRKVGMYNFHVCIEQWKRENFSRQRQFTRAGFYVTSVLCFTLLYVVALCVKMRYVILCIKRLLIDWLIDWLLVSSTLPHSMRTVSIANKITSYRYWQSKKTKTDEKSVQVKYPGQLDAVGMQLVDEEMCVASPSLLAALLLGRRSLASAAPRPWPSSS